MTEDQQKIDMTYYGIELEIDISNQEITGSVLINGSVGMDQPDSIELDLASELVVDSIVSSGELLSFDHADDMIKIPTQPSIPEGYDFSFEVFYHGHPPSTGFGSFNFDEHLGVDHIWTLSEPYGARDWWPCKDDPSDKVDSLDIIIIVPEEQIAVSNGILLEETELGDGRKRYHWSERYPICTYLVSITTYPYTKWEDYYIGLNGDTLPLEYYVYPDHYDLVYENYMLTDDMMEVFADRFGEYPFMGEKYGHAEFGRGGGMEHQTITSLGGHSQWLIAHELGHQWWGDLITCASFHHIWLNEGFARFSESIWDEATGGFDAYKDYWQNHSYFGDGTIYVEEPDTPSQIFNGNLTYNKAGWVVHMLRGVLGDSLFFETLRTYALNDSLAYSSATTEDFQLVCEDVSGLDLEDFFQQWIYGEYYPKYGLAWEMSESNELIVTIEQTQNWQYFHMPIELRVLVPGDTLIFKVDNQSQTEHYNLGFVDGLPHAIWLDPDNWILKEVEYTSMGGILPNKPQITIYPAYPNPFNPQTSIRYFVPEQLGYVQLSISIYDIRGHIADSFDIGSILPGMHEFVWNADRQGSGIYFIQFSIEGRSYAQKIQLVK
jgi:aminopeptidase N